jgi:tRNA (mo5U34)-methyltransferase
MKIDLTEKELKDEIYRLAPFHHKIELPYGLSTYVPEKSRRSIEYTRLNNLVRHAFPALIDACGGSLHGRRVLDVACNCGGFSVEAAKRGAEYVLGFDIVMHYIEQANLIKRALKLEQVDFKLMGIDEIAVSTVGQFDITFCFGILYHLENPVLAMKRLSSVTQHAMLVDTDLEPISWKRRSFSGFFVRRPFWLMNVDSASGPESSSATTSLWRKDRVVQFRPNDVAVVELLKFLGFPKVLKLKPTLKPVEKRYLTGERGTFLALRV